MIGAALYFKNKITNNFHLPCGMIGPTLFDVVAITGLFVSGPTATFDMKPERRCNIIEKNSYGEFIKHNMGDDGSPFTDDEYVAFLYYWFNAIVFCLRSVSMQKLFIPLAGLIHEKRKFSLAKLLLGSLYDELGQMINSLRSKTLISAGGPLWLLQLWLNAIFEKTYKTQRNCLHRKTKH
ncbi:hypothetical protein AHAS_Ahas13G0378900 [Arachis hypogaea]